MNTSTRRPLSLFTNSRGDALVRACAASLLSTADGVRETGVRIASREWGRESDPAILLRAAVSPASTTSVGDMFVASAVHDFLVNLAPASAGSVLLSRGLQLSFGEFGSIVIPNIVVGTGSTAFVAEGAPIPARQLTLDGISLTPDKLASIVSFTHETLVGSLPNIVGVVGQVLTESVGLDSYMGGKVDSHKTTEVRSQLGPLKDFTEQCDIAASAITHPAKNAGHKAIDHFIGSQAFIAAARIGHACFEEIGEDEKPTGRVLFTNPKNNPNVKMPTLAYRIAEIIVGQDPSGGNIASPHVVWGESPVDISADAAIAATTTANGGRDDGREARAFLRTILAQGPRLHDEIVEEADQLGFTEKQLKTAKRKLGVKSFKQPGVMNGPWYWQLPEIVL
jgi:hypothetical protein